MDLLLVWTPPFVGFQIDTRLRMRCVVRDNIVRGVPALQELGSPLFSPSTAVMDGI